MQKLLAELYVFAGGELSRKAGELYDAIAAVEIREAELATRAISTGDELVAAEWLLATTELTALTIEACELCAS